MKAVTIPLGQPLPHKQKVLSVYKQILRNLESWYHYRPAFRYQATLMRAQFDKYKNVPKEIGSQLLSEAEEELRKKKHYAIKQFPYTIGGLTYDRAPHVPDWILDYWHPLEKAQFPDYFSKREKRKQEYITFWENKYGPRCPKKDH